MVRRLSIILLLTFSFCANGKELNSFSDVEELSQQAMTLVGKGEPADAIQLFRPHMSIPDAEFQMAFEQLRLQQPVMDQRFGKTIGSEYISNERYGESWAQVTFLQKFENHAMRWRLWFYKPSDKWILSTYLTDDQVKNWFSLPAISQ